MGWVEVTTHVVPTTSAAAVANPPQHDYDLMHDWLKRNAGTWGQDWFSEGWKFYVRDHSVAAAFKLMFG
jgi:hypothetical protein